MPMSTHGLRGIALGRQGIDMKQSINPFRAPGRTTNRPAPNPQRAKASERARGPRVQGRFGLGGNVDVSA